MNEQENENPGILEKVQPYIITLLMLGAQSAAMKMIVNELPFLNNNYDTALIVFGLFHILGRVADIASTHLVTKKNKEVEDALGIQTQLHETSIFHPKPPDSKEMLKPGKVMIELGQALPITIAPTIYGMGTGILSLKTAYKNYRYYRSLQETLGEIPINPKFKKQNQRKK